MQWSQGWQNVRVSSSKREGIYKNWPRISTIRLGSLGHSENFDQIPILFINSPVFWNFFQVFDLFLNPADQGSSRNDVTSFLNCRCSEIPLNFNTFLDKGYFLHNFSSTVTSLMVDPHSTKFYKYSKRISLKTHQNVLQISAKKKNSKRKKFPE